MEPVVKEYLLRIVNTITYTALWMIVNITAGIMFELAIIERQLQWKNIAFYAFLIISFMALLKYLIHIWKKPLPFEK